MSLSFSRYLALLSLTFCGLVSTLSAEESQVAQDPLPVQNPHAVTTTLPGQSIYEAKCAKCHGNSGEGVADVYDENLYGDRPFAELVKIINDTMPDEKPEECVGEEAQQVAEYMYETFYTATARAKHQPPRIELSRLTVSQYQNTIADLAGYFLSNGPVNDKRGLQAKYYNDRRSKKEELKIERIDPVVQFDFATAGPNDQINEEEFFVSWNGGLIVEETGEYEIGIKTQNGFEFWMNDSEEPLIDRRVVSGNDVQEQTATLKLLGGRSYALRLEFFKEKRKDQKNLTASVELRWKPPHKEWETIPERNLSPEWFPKVLVVKTTFPPDDSSLGYARGTSISRAWDDSTTYAALEVIDYILANKKEFTRKHKADSEQETFRKFCIEFGGLAFRRPFNDDQKNFYVDRIFNGLENPTEAFKQSLLLILKSPNFLYLNAKAGPVDSFDVASRLSYTMWDSMPDSHLWNEAQADRLQNRDQISDLANKMVNNPRTKLKMRGFFDHLLQLEEADDIDKDADTFPGFDAQLLADLRTSLLLFVDEVVWSERSDFRELLLSNDLYLNQRLADFYEVKFDHPSGFERVSLDTKQRAGVVTHPFLLSALAYHKSTSPIHRGVFVTRRLLGRSLKPPPMAIEFMDSRFDPNLTMREKVSELTKSKTCMTCHSVINPLGFSLEHYDAVGRFRTIDKDKPVDASGVYTTPEGVQVTLGGARDLAEHIAISEVAQVGFVEELFHHMVKQPGAAYGDQTLNELRDKLAGNDFNIKKLAVEIALTSAAFGLPEKK